MTHMTHISRIDKSEKNDKLLAMLALKMGAVKDAIERDNNDVHKISKG